MPWNCSQKKHIQLPPVQEQQQQQQTREIYQHAVGPSTSVAGFQHHQHGNIPEEAFRKIRHIDEQTSTLTAKGVQGFSTRILSKNEDTVIGDDGRKDVYVTQLIEIIKKPGQSLGLFLREGNGRERDSGVFVSRLASNTDLEQSGLIKPGDEIFCVNDVYVKELPLETVVYTLSITKRLILRISYYKSRRGVAVQEEKPVVMFQKSTDLDRRDSEASSSGILSKPGNTASTWLGKKVRQEQLKQQQQQAARMKNESTRDTFSPRSQRHSSNVQQQQRQHFPQQQQQQTLYRASAGGSGGSTIPYRLKQPPPKDRSVAALWPAAQEGREAEAGVEVGVTRTPAIIPPPRGQPLHAMHHHHQQQQPQQHTGASYQQHYPPLYAPHQPHMMLYPPLSSSAAAPFQPQHPLYQAATLGRPHRPHPVVSSAPVKRRQFFYSPDTFAGASSSPYFTRSTLGAIDGWMDPYGQRYPPLMYPPLPPQYPAAMIQDLQPYPGGSNSLPRRSPATVIGAAAAYTGSAYPRTVKWRNDVMDSDIADILDSPRKSPSRRPYSGRSAMSDVEVDVYTCRRSAGGGSYTRRPWNWERATGGGSGKTMADIFSAQEYRTWAAPPLSGFEHDHRRSRWATAQAPHGSASIRSSSLPSKTLFERTLWDSKQEKSVGVEGALPQQALPAYDPMLESGADFFDRLHVSPLMNRRVPLRTAGPGFDVDRLSSGAFNTLTGVLIVSVFLIKISSDLTKSIFSIAEGKDLRIPDKVHSKSLYVVVEVNEEHRARTGISLPEQHFQWNERFEIDVYKASDVEFFIYSWHPQLRHRFCHKGAIKLMDAFFIDQLTGQRFFALKLEREGQLLIKIGFTGMAECYKRHPPSIHHGRMVFGQPLAKLFQIEQKETPIVLTRLIREIEARGVDTTGLYYLSGAVDRKLMIRHELERDTQNADIRIGPVPDINLLACLVKDFLRELPEPLIPPNVYVMLINAVPLILPSDTEGNQKLILKIVDCLPKSNRNTLILLMEHLRALLASEPLNGLNSQRVTIIFGPLIFCTAREDPCVVEKVDLLSIEQAGQALKLLLEHWPRVNSSESSDSSTPPASAPIDAAQQSCYTTTNSGPAPQRILSGKQQQPPQEDRRRLDTNTNS